MGQAPALPMLDEIAELAAALEQEWPHRQAALRASGVPLNDGEDGDGEDGGDDTADDSDAGDGAAGNDDAATDSDDGLDAEALRVELKKTRAEAAKHRVAAREAAALAKKYEDANKTKEQKLEERASTAEARAEAAERKVLVASVALDKGLTQAQAKRLIGDTKEELEADADELLESFKPEEESGQDPTKRRPRERLRPGAVPAATAEETDPAKLAAQVPRRY